MKLIASSIIITLLSLSTLSYQSGDKFVYADFEKMENGRPVSSNGGFIQIYTGNESTPVSFKGLANASPGAPELIVLKDAPSNHLATFEYNLVGPNQWANVTLEVQGRPAKDGNFADVKHLDLFLVGPFAVALVGAQLEQARFFLGSGGGNFELRHALKGHHQ